MAKLTVEKLQGAVTQGLVDDFGVNPDEVTDTAHLVDTLGGIPTDYVDLLYRMKKILRGAGAPGNVVDAFDRQFIGDLLDGLLALAEGKTTPFAGIDMLEKELRADGKIDPELLEQAVTRWGGRSPIPQEEFE